jgi:hypothetical protein
MFSLFKKSPPFTEFKINLETNYSETLLRNHLYVIQCINDDILAANKVLKLLNLLRQNNIDLSMWPKMKSEIGEIYCRYEQGKFYVSFPWAHPSWISPIRGVERFIRG